MTRCSITSSGACENRKVVPWCPSCPPLFFSLFVRKLFGCRTKRSEEGGKLLLWLSFASRSCKSFTRLGSKPQSVLASAAAAGFAGRAGFPAAGFFHHALPLVHAGADFLLQCSCLYFTGFHNLWQVPSGPGQLQPNLDAIPNFV